LLKSVARRIVDRRVLHLSKMWLFEIPGPDVVLELELPGFVIGLESIISVVSGEIPIRPSGVGAAVAQRRRH
jgi:hypothetical protein